MDNSAVCAASIPYGYWFQSRLLHFQSSYLLMQETSGRKMTQEHGLQCPRGKCHEAVVAGARAPSIESDLAQVPPVAATFLEGPSTQALRSNSPGLLPPRFHLNFPQLQ